MGIIGGFLLTVGIMVVSSIFEGFTLSVIWGWLIVPVFHLPPLSIPTAIGVALVIGYLTGHETHQSKDEDSSFVGAMLFALIWSVINAVAVLFFGWVVHLYI